MVSKTTRLVCGLSLAYVATVFSIYVPDVTNKKAVNSAGIKTLGWQSANGDQFSGSRVELHHNYSRVQNVNNPDRTGRFANTFDRQSSTTVDPTSPNIDDHLATGFGRQREDNFDEQLRAESGQPTELKVNDHLVELNSGPTKGTARLNDQLDFGDRPNRNQQVNDHLADFANVQASSRQERLSSDLGYAHKANDHLTDDFSHQETQTYSSSRETRRFTNAHAGRSYTSPSQQLKKAHSERPVAYKKCPKRATGQFAYELSCNQFLNCWKGRGHVQNCAPGTLFNPATSECDYPEKVECVSGSRWTTPENAEPLSAALQATCPDGFSGIIPHYTDCSKFISCVDGTEVAMDCAPGTLFDIRTNVCDHPYKAECANRPAYRPETGGGGSNLGQSGGDSRFHQGFANKFVSARPYDGGYQRYGGANVAAQGGSSWSQQQNNGGHLGTSTGQQIRANDNLGEFSNANVVAQGGSPWGQQQNSGGHLGTSTGQQIRANDNLEEFASTTNGEQINPSYTGGFDSRPSQSGGAHDNTFGQSRNPPSFFPTNETLSDDPAYCRNHPGLSAHPSDCSKFLYCTEGKLLVLLCEQGTFYNPARKTCGFNRECLADDRRTHDQSYGSRERPECPPHHTGLFPHPTVCSKFLNCANGQTFVQECGPGTVFNPDLKACDYSYKVACRDQTGQEETQGYRTQEPKCPPFESGLFPHPTNCSMFLNCANGRTFVQECGAGTVFNPGLKVCDYPDRVECAQNPTQEAQGQRFDGRNQNGRWQNQNGQGVNANLGGVSQNGRWQNQNVQGLNENQGGVSQNGRWQTQNQQWQNQNKQWQGQNVDRNADGLLGQQNKNGEQQQNWNEQTRWNLYGQTWADKFNRSRDSDQNQNFDANHSDGQNHNYDQNQNFQQNLDRQQNRNYGWSGKSEFEDQSQAAAETQGTWSDQFNNRGTLSGNNSTDQHVDRGPSRHSPPPFPSTDTNADYVFEDDDGDDVLVPERKHEAFCEADDFKCADAICVSQSTVCDGYKDCPGAEDEVNCEKYVEQFSRLSGTKLAVREKEKLPNVTVTSCAKYCMESKGFQCKSFNYRKNDGVCFVFDTNVGLSGSLFMLANYDYYEYAKFTVDCTDRYRCNNRKCIEYGQVCDGVNDCADRMDEKGCKAEQLGYRVELVGTGKKHEGVVQVSAFGRTGYVCDDMFGLRDADVLCKELGFAMGALEIQGNSHFVVSPAKPNETFYMMDDVTCLGNETSLRDCDFNGWGVHNCMEQEVVGVVCKTPQKTCPKDYWRCETGNECLPLAFVCDGVDDCDDKSDEAAQYCEAPIELRLVGGKSKSEGRVEIKYHGTWGTICDDDFNDDAAKVICKYLGLGGAARTKKDAFFGPGDGPIWLDQTYCQGNESAIQDCYHWDWGEHNCEHAEDVGVICDDQGFAHQVHVEAQRNAKLPDLLPKSLFPERCGYRNDDIFLEGDGVHFRVVKGSAARRGDYPWQASLRVKGKAKPTHWCGAVVISERFVLTAAHCLDGFTKGAYVVVAGDYQVDLVEGTEQQAYIEDFYTHEDFRNGTRMNNDIALVKLKGGGFNLTKDVQPICLPEADFVGEQGLNCTISGFGSIQSGKAVASKELRAGWIPIQATEVCKMPHVYGAAITEGMLCAGSLDEGVDACDGDSGGPLACLHNGFFTLMGLTSWGQHCGYANKPGVYVKISHYRDWIGHTMEKHS